MSNRSILLLITGISLTSVAVVVFNKKKQLDHILDKIQFKLVSIKNFKFSLKQFSMDLVIRAVNPTSEDFNINTGFLKAKVIRVFEKKTGKLLAFSNLDTSKINLPSGGFFDLPSVYIEIPSLTGAQYLLNELSGKDTQNIINNFSFELDVSALGKTTTIKF